MRVSLLLIALLPGFAAAQQRSAELRVSPFMAAWTFSSLTNESYTNALGERSTSRSRIGTYLPIGLGIEYQPAGKSWFATITVERGNVSHHQRSCSPQASGIVGCVDDDSERDNAMNTFMVGAVRQVARNGRLPTEYGLFMVQQNLGVEWYTGSDVTQLVNRGLSGLLRWTFPIAHRAALQWGVRGIGLAVDAKTASYPNQSQSWMLGASAEATLRFAF